MSNHTQSKPAIIRSDNPNALDRALEILHQGGLVAVPTETVYGLAADATNAQAVAGIFAAKGRPSFNPLISHIADRDRAERYGIFDARAKKLAATFWPGSLTLVVPSAPDSPVADLVRAGLDTVALRCPQNSFTRRLIKAFGAPLAAPSANPSGRLSPTHAEHVANGFSADTVPLIVDGGPCDIGLESTIVAVLPDQPVTVLRSGLVTETQLADALPGILVKHYKPRETAPNKPMAPGMLLSHYAPNAPVVLADDTTTLKPGDALLTFAGASLSGAEPMARLDLSAKGDLLEAAANLFSMLHALDARKPQRIVAVAPPADGIGLALSDRLQRAAAPRNSDG